MRSLPYYRIMMILCIYSNIVAMTKESPSTFSFGQQFLISACAGLATTVAIEPFSYLKYCQQQKIERVANIRTISNIRTVYRGVFINGAGFVPAMAIRSSVYLQMVASLQGYDLPTSTVHITSAAAAGVASAVPSTFRELLVAQQTRHGGCFTELAQQLIRAHGITSAFTGFVPIALRNSSFAGFFFIVTPTIARYFQQYTHNQYALAFGPSSVAGALSAVVTHPVDMVKAHMQARMPEKLTLKATVRNLYYATGSTVGSIGMHNFFRGLLPRVAAVATTMMLEYNFRAFFARYAS